MKKLKYAALGFLLVASTASNIGTIPAAFLEWQAPTFYVDGTELSAENISHFTVHYGPVTQSYTDTMDIPGTERSAYITVRYAGTWYFAMTATDIFGETSALSNEVMRTLSDGRRRAKPINIRLVIL